MVKSCRVKRPYSHFKEDLRDLDYQSNEASSEKMRWSTPLIGTGLWLTYEVKRNYLLFKITVNSCFFCDWLNRQHFIFNQYLYIFHSSYSISVIKKLSDYKACNSLLYSTFCSLSFWIEIKNLIIDPLRECNRHFLNTMLSWFYVSHFFYWRSPIPVEHMECLRRLFLLTTWQ